MSGLLLINPKYPANLAGALRACAAWDAQYMRWTGNRVLSGLNRLPRELRMREYDHVSVRSIAGARPVSDILEEFPNTTPVCVEVGMSHESLNGFEHPQNALYVFGPEDGSVPSTIKQHCHRFIRIPTPTTIPLNLVAAINIVLYDRQVCGLKS